VKVLAGGECRSSESRDRFAHEARAIAALDHPHICALYDVGEQDGIDYLVMPLLDGETLAARLARRPLPLAQALPIAVQIADALDRAHRAGFVHRDLKPGNIMLVAAPSSQAGVPQVKLLDFGLAKLSAPTTSGAVSALSTLTAGVPGLTESGAIVGTPQYMAPEQVEGKAVDSRTDVFAFGAVLHEMLSGRRAFEGDSAAGVIAAILERQPPALSTLQPEVPPALDAIVRRCLAKSPDARFQSAADLRFALESLPLTTSMSATASTASRQANTSRNRWRAAALVGLAVALPSTWWLVRARSSSDAADVPTVLNPQQVTNSVGVEDYPSWSPDGRTLAFAADPLGHSVEVGNWDI
jgi:serine/threonine protein kinase